MLLMKLKNQEKFAFLHLAHYVANIDGKPKTKEKNIIEEYCTEMGIENIEVDLNDINLYEILNQIKNQRSKRIILLEIMILIHSDDDFTKFEKEIINKIINFFNEPKENIELYSQWGKIVSALYLQGKFFIGEKNKD